MPASRRAPRMRLVGRPTQLTIEPSRTPGPRISRKKLHPIRIPKIKERPVYLGPSAMERASIPLASYALRVNRMNRRSTLPQLTREMIDAEIARIRGMQTPKEWRNYLSTLERGNERYTRPGKKNGETVWKEEERKSIRIGKKKGEAVKQLSLTNYGKFEKLYMDPAGREWKQMTPEHQKRMADYVITTIDKYHSSTKQNFSDGTYRRMKTDEVKSARIPTLQKMIGKIFNQIENDTYVWNQMKKEGRDPVMTREMEKTIRGMQNRMSILQGVERALAEGAFTPSNKARGKKRGAEKNPGTDPNIVEGGRKIVEGRAQRAKEQMLLPAVTATMREKWRKITPLTQEEVQEAVRRRNTYLKEKQLENEWDRAIRAGDPIRTRIARERYEGELRRRAQNAAQKPIILRAEARQTPGNRRVALTQEQADQLYGGPTGVGYHPPAQPKRLKRIKTGFFRAVNRIIDKLLETHPDE